MLGGKDTARVFQLLGVTTVFLLISLIALSWQNTPEPQVFRGLVHLDFHGNSFWECSEPDPWGITGETAKVIDAYERLVGEPASIDGDAKHWIYAEVEGYLSTEGMYGPWNMYNRQIEITTTRSVQLNFETSCHDNHDFAKPTEPKHDPRKHYSRDI